jgi:flagellar motility protein MotE (MotC chaperone)
MSEPTRVYVSRLLRLPLIDHDGVPIGPISDLVLAPGGTEYAPYLVGYVVSVQRRSIFVNANRAQEISSRGVRLNTATVDLGRYRRRSGEIVVRSDVLDKKIRKADIAGSVIDLELQPDPSEPETWEVTQVVLSSSGLLRRRNTTSVPWRDLVAELFDRGDVGRQVSELRELHPSDAAQNIAALSPEDRRELAEALDDEELADVLEELAEDQQVAFIEELEIERAADIIEEMDADDAVDLLAELPDDEREEILDAMEPEDSGPLRRLLRYDSETAGGIMTPDPVVLSPSTTVAEALARIRFADVKAIDGATVYVVEPPLSTPTGRYLGSVGFQRLLREPPSAQLSGCLQSDPTPIGPHVSQEEVARRLASRDTTGIPVCDDAGHLLGAVTVDDVLDHMLPANWRQQTGRL